MDLAVVNNSTITVLVSSIIYINVFISFISVTLKYLEILVFHNLSNKIQYIPYLDMSKVLLLTIILYCMHSIRLFSKFELIINKLHQIN